ncbi:VOC family protein [Streptomyces sp. NPDC003691]
MRGRRVDHRTLHWKLTIDAADPLARADFRATALGYLVEDHSVLIAGPRAQGYLPEGSTERRYGRDVWRDYAAVRHPGDPYDEAKGVGRQLLFQRIPEPKTVKNRLHLDPHPGQDRREAEVERLRGLGATVLYEQHQPIGVWTTMADPEGT